MQMSMHETSTMDGNTYQNRYKAHAALLKYKQLIYTSRRLLLFFRHWVAAALIELKASKAPLHSNTNIKRYNNLTILPMHYYFTSSRTSQ